ncbi:Putative phage peptidase protein [Xanthomonas phage Suba]|uniref:Phage peptidase protein n=1 Tax=Xanthomonas phage Suba TaxID=2674975 RepID=A0A679KKH4_9CAUD|nr:Putative phage peptidase protein [Xanthomonas phage Suba]CAA2409777.1 Putative phage peptidase protein [Xanthomonas phage Suba]
MGIVTDYPGAVGLIHTDSMVGEVTEHRLDEKWLRRIVYVWRV